MADKRAPSIRVWDLPVRLFHWALVVLMAISYFTGRAGDDWMKFHFWSGYAILTLILFRIAWGSSAARRPASPTSSKAPRPRSATFGSFWAGTGHARLVTTRWAAPWS